MQVFTIGATIDYIDGVHLAYADAGVEPIDFPIAPTVALPLALQKANLSIDDISLFEINEAFSVVVRIAEKVLKIDPAKINVNGYVFCYE
jgi:acetyl-CoA C-acetyltransferase